MKLKDEILNKFPFLKTKTVKYLFIFSIIRRIGVLIFLILFDWKDFF